MAASCQSGENNLSGRTPKTWWIVIKKSTSNRGGSSPFSGLEMVYRNVFSRSAICRWVSPFSFCNQIKFLDKISISLIGRKPPFLNTLYPEKRTKSTNKVLSLCYHSQFFVENKTFLK